MGQTIVDRWTNTDKASIGFWVNVIIIAIGVIAPIISASPWGALQDKLFLVTCLASIAGGLKTFDKLIGGTPVSTDKQS